MMRFPVVVLLLVLAASGSGEVRPSRFQSRDAWAIDAARLRVTIMKSGGHIAEIVLKDKDAVNPLWVQNRPTIDASDYDPAKHERSYGGGSGARLMSGLVGHNLCFPYWGNPSASETRAGMTYHGEAGITMWRQVTARQDEITVTAEFPESRTRFTRTVRVSDQIAYFDSTGENLAAWDRVLGWCEHATIGPPFLEREQTLMDASLTRGRMEKQEFTWPSGRAEKPIDLRKVRSLQGHGFVNNFLVDPARQYGFWAAVNPRLRLLFGYVFPRADYPWLNIWEANEAAMLTRGMEFSNTPVHGTLKTLLREPQLFGLPAFEWLDARSSLRKRFAAFSARVPEGYRGVADVSIHSGKLEIAERESGRRITLPFDPRW